MTDALLALLPEYGLYLIALLIFVAAFGIPLPSSLIALTSGGLAATGDFELIELLLTIFFAYALGDQIAFTLGQLAKPEWIQALRSSQMLGTLVVRSERFYKKRGLLAVFLSRTVMSSIGPYISYSCGALGMKRLSFSIVALFGISIWTNIYVYMGYLFAGNLLQMSNLVAGFLMAGIAALFTLAFATKLIIAWKHFKMEAL